MPRLHKISIIRIVFVSLIRETEKEGTMANSPINLALRFGLEIAALVALGYWGWTQNAGLWRIAAVVGLPLIAAILWGTFRVPGDPGDAPVAVPGIVRLLVEALVFGGAVMALFAAKQQSAAWLLLGLLAFHYAISYDRIQWLLSNK